ncbi:hypothetical protein OSTOST_23070, partial [Ostertagia ostertagi]
QRVEEVLIFDRDSSILVAGKVFVEPEPIRYDHMASLCEIMPTGTPSMVLNTQIALIGANKNYDKVTMK